MKTLYLVLAFILASAVGTVYAQSTVPEVIFRDFTPLFSDPKLGKVHPNDLAVRQDGLVILAINQGVVTFDGERWVRYEHPQNRRCTSVAVDARSQIFVGFDSDFGILEPDISGSLRFRSLITEFPELSNSLPICLRIETNGEKIFFGCTVGIAAWSTNRVDEKEWLPFEPSQRAQCFWMSKEVLHVATTSGRGEKHFLRYQDGDLEEFAHSENSTINSSFATGGCGYSDSEQLLVTYDKGLFRVSQGSVSKFECEASEFAIANFAKGIRNCPDGTFVMAAEKGIAFFDRDGRVLDQLLTSDNDSLGIARNTPLIDHEQQMWIPVFGAAVAIRIDLRSKIRYWKTKIINPNWAFQSGNTYWIGGTGLVRCFSYTDKPELNYDVLLPRSLDAIEVGDELIFSSSNGMRSAPIQTSQASSDEPKREPPYQSEDEATPGTNPVQLIQEAVSLAMGVRLPHTNSLLYATMSNGIEHYEKVEGKWVNRGSIPGLAPECRDIRFEAAHNRVWFTCRTEQGRWHIGRLTLDPLDPLLSTDVRVYPHEITGTDYSIAIWNGRVLFNSQAGLKYFDEQLDRFVALELPLPSLEEEWITSAIEVDTLQQLWIHVLGVGLYRIRSNNTAELVYPAIENVIRIRANPRSKSIFVISSRAGLLQIPMDFDILERALPAINLLKSTKGNRSKRRVTDEARESNICTISYSAQSANLHSSAKYQFRLIGLSNEWSPWSVENQQSFHGLAPGSYEFQVRCQSRWLEEGPISSISLVIPTPWYATSWARILAGLVLISGGLAVVSWRIRNERERADRLERKVQERTTELSLAKSELENRVRSRTQDLETANRQLLDEIDQRIRAEESLYESEQRYRTIVEGQSEMIVRFDSRGFVTFANQAFCRQFAIQEPEVVNTDLRSLMDPQFSTILEELMVSTPATLEARSLRQQISRRERLVWEEWTIHAMLDAHGCFTALQAVGRDVTTLVETQEKLRTKEDYLRHASRLSMLGEMVASITHELRQPLGSISNFAYATEETLNQSNIEQAPLLASWNHQIVEQIARADTIVRRLRGFARRADAEIENCNINRVIEDTLSMLQFELRKAEVEVKLDLAEGLPEIPYVRVQLEQVLVNLIRNACDAMGTIPIEDPQVEIATSLSGNAIEVRVSDNGPGVPESLASHVFEPFHSTKKEGLGLGLAISRSIIEDSGGKIWLDTRRPGATFVFTLLKVVHVE